MFAIEVIAEELREVVAGLEPETYSGDDAARLTEVCATGERLFASAKALLARRASDTNGWRRDGSQAVTPEQWLARTSGTSEGQARDTLKTAERIKELPATEERLRDGTLSMSQASLVSKAATANPDAEQRLLRTARREGLGTLRDTADRVLSAATDDDEAHATAKRERHFRTWRSGMATHGSFSGPSEEADVLLRALEPLAKARGDEARKAGEREPYDAYRFDAVVTLAQQGGGGVAAPPVARVRVDLPALLAGETSPGEVCEIPGVGSVPVGYARKVLSHGLLELVITDGVNVRTVVSTTRHVPEALKIAIAERDERCKVRGCDRTQHLERHHTKPFAEHRLTTYDVLGLVCGAHHDLVTYDGHEIVDHDDGTWSLAPPNERRDSGAA